MEKFILPKKNILILLTFTFIGIISLATGFVVDSHRAWAGTLVLTFFLLSLGLAGTFFAALQLIAGAKWSIVVRRVAESSVGILPFAGCGLLAIFFGAHSLYEWTHKDVVAADHILHQKEIYLNLPFWITRIVIFFLAWLTFGLIIRKMSIKADSNRDPKAKSKLIKVAVGYIILFAYSILISSIDLIMSLEPHWFTTMYPVYIFSGIAYTGVSAMIIVVVTIQAKGGLKEITQDHMHDMGKYLFMFVVFWAYIAFSQIMLTWYSNLPEETAHVENRLYGHWKIFTPVFWVCHFLVPFIWALPRDVKRNGKSLVKVAWFTLFMGFVDIVWLVYGAFNIETLEHNILTFPFSWMEFGLFLGGVGLAGLAFFKTFGSAGQIPKGDPDLETSLHFHQTH